MKNALQKILYGYKVKFYVFSTLLFFVIISLSSCTQEELENSDTVTLQKGLPTGCDIISIRGNNGGYVTSGTSSIIANRSSVGSQERFEIIRRSNGKLM